MGNKNKVKGLNKRRSSIKSSLKRLSAFLADFNGDAEELVERVAQAKELFKSFNEVQNELEEYDDDEDLTDERALFEAEYYSFVAGANKYIKSKTAEVKNVHAKTSIKLPTINLPSFDGRYDEWMPFMHAFKALVGQNPSLTNVQRLQYLNSTLKGDAYQAIKSLEITDANYANAIATLTHRYENKRLITQSHLREIFNIPSIHKESASGLRQVLESTMKRIQALKALGRPVDHWDDLIVYLISTKIDAKTQQEWEGTIETTEMPSLEKIEEFIMKRCRFLELLDSTKESKSQGSLTPKKATMMEVKAIKCPICEGEHYINHCERFLLLSPAMRTEYVDKRSLCFNCLRPNHQAAACFSSKCRKCKKLHNTLLHIDLLDTNRTEDQIIVNANHGGTSNQVLLSTAVILIVDERGNGHEVRALLDSGSQVNIMTEGLMRRLHLKLRSNSITLNGINNAPAQVIGLVATKVKSLHERYEKALNFVVLNKITGRIPARTFDSGALNIPKNIKLADPHFHKSTEIDLLIGAEIYIELLSTGQINRKPAILQKTRLGWILGGIVPCLQNNSVCCVTSRSINNNMKQLWMLDAVKQRNYYTLEDKYFEKHFMNTVRRDKHGCLIVSLPVKEQTEALGNSCRKALQRLCSVENKLHLKCMQEYEQLEHMTKRNQDYFLPRQAVVNLNSTTMKLRVVFEASAKTSNGMALNNLLYEGPVVQQYQYVISADVTKMYRQIKINPVQIKLQRILWRDHACEEVGIYEMNSLTYGTASFIATRFLEYLAEEEAVSSIVKRVFYVDDLLTGIATIEEAKRLKYETEIILGKGKFELRKWKSDELTILNCEDTNNDNYVLLFDKSQSPKTLGIFWNTQSDTIQYSVAEVQTNRIILLEALRLFDPLGLMVPANSFLQRLWAKWDEAVDQQTESTWREYCEKMKLLRNANIKRKVVSNSLYQIEIHAFSDARELAYGSVVYVKILRKSPQVTLLCAKAKVSKHKQISVPKLELCGAFFLAKLVRKIIELELFSINYYTDSTIVLNWIRSDSRKWKTFVANRIGENVSTQENPVNLCSRGVSTNYLLNSSLWWNGLAIGNSFPLAHHILEESERHR